MLRFGGTVKSRWRFYCYFKKANNVNERRMNMRDKDIQFEYGIKIKSRHIDQCDDKIRGDIRDRRCWKNKKVKRQYLKNY